MYKDLSKVKIELSGIPDLQSIQNVEASILDSWSGDSQDILIDLSKVLDLSTAIIPALLKFYLRCKTYHIQLFFIAPSPRIILVLKKSGLLEVFPVFLSEEEYLQGNRIQITDSKFL